MLIPLLLLMPISFIECHLHDLEVTTEPSWAPTGRLNQFNGFATPRPSLLPANAQMVYASVWAAWSAWSFCSDSKRIRVRACNTVRGFRCLGPNQQSEPCDPSTSPILGNPPRPNTISSDDYDTVDPWQEDRVEALKQLYPDESIDEKLNHLPEHEKLRLRARLLPPSPMSHELLNRPVNDKDGAPGATPEKLFGARPKAFGVKSRAFVVPSVSVGQLNLPDFLSDDQFLAGIPNEDKQLGNQQEKLENLAEIGNIDEFTKSVDAAEQQSFEQSSEEQRIRTKSRGEGTFSANRKQQTFLKSNEDSSEAVDISENTNEVQKLSDSMNGPEFSDRAFTGDIFGSIQELMNPTTTTMVPIMTTTTTIETTERQRPITTTTTPQPFTTTTTTTTTTPQPPTTVRTTTMRRPPMRVTPRFPTVIPDDTVVELVTPSIITDKIKSEIISFFEEGANVEQETTTKKPWKSAIHDGEVTPRTVPPTTTTSTTTTETPSTATTTLSSFPVPEEISLDTLHALDWMLANMTNAAEEGARLQGNELRLKLDNFPNDPSSAVPSTKMLSKKPPTTLKEPKKRVKTHRTKTIKLHYGEVLPADQALVNKKFPKFKNRNAHRAKIFGIKTSSIPEDRLKIQTKKDELVDEINDLKDLMEQMDERIESRSALMEENYDSILKPKHQHDSPYRHRQV